MKTLSEIKDELKVPEYPKKKFLYYAYKNGEAKRFDNSVEATKFSHNHEKVEIEHDIYQKELQECTTKHNEAYRVWYNQLYDELHDLPKTYVDYIYNFIGNLDEDKEYERYPDELVYKMIELHKFIMKAIPLIPED